MTSPVPEKSNTERHPGEYSSAPPWSPAVVRIWATVLGVALFIFLLMLQPIWLLAGGALLVAYMVSPLVDWVQSTFFRGARRGAAVAIVLLLFVSLGVLLLLMVFPALVTQFIAGLDAGAKFIQNLSSQPLTIGGEPVDDSDGNPVIVSELITRFLENNDLETVAADLWIQLGMSVSSLRSLAFGSLRLIQALAESLITLSLSLLLFTFIVFYLLQDGHKLVATVVAIAPDGFQDDLARLLTELGRVWNDYLRGQLILSLIMGASMWLIATAMGLPQPLFFALIAAFMEFIPNIGPTIALLPPAITGLVVTSATLPGLSGIPVAITIVVLWFIMQQLEALVLVPVIVGGSLRLHPVVMILAVIWGASFGGLIGVIVAGPIVASLRIIGHYIYGRLTGRTSFAAPEPEEPEFIQQATEWVRRTIKTWRETLAAGTKSK